MMKTGSLYLIFKNEDGASSGEFALCALIFFTLIFASINASILGYSAMSLHSATEAAARCRAMGTTCSDATTTQNFAVKAFHNVAGQVPTFISDTQTCGNRVRGNLNYSFNWIIASKTVPITTASCFSS